MNLTNAEQAALLKLAHKTMDAESLSPDALQRPDGTWIFDRIPAGTPWSDGHPVLDPVELAQWHLAKKKEQAAQAAADARKHDDFCALMARDHANKMKFFQPTPQ